MTSILKPGGIINGARGILSNRGPATTMPAATPSRLDGLQQRAAAASAAKQQSALYGMQKNMINQPSTLPSQTQQQAMNAQKMQAEKLAQEKMAMAQADKMAIQKGQQQQQLNPMNAQIRNGLI